MRSDIWTGFVWLSRTHVSTVMNILVDDILNKDSAPNSTDNVKYFERSILTLNAL
jgi:hypothetical protein